jgi:hypothetical protein
VSRGELAGGEVEGVMSWQGQGGRGGGLVAGVMWQERWARNIGELAEMRS